MRVSDESQSAEFDVMDYAIRTCGTLRQALENTCRYNWSLHDVAEFELMDDGKTAYFDHYFKNDPKGTNWHAVDFTLASVYAIGLGITGRHWVPKQVCFQHDEPTDIALYQKVFPCMLKFNCERNRLVFESDLLEFPVVGSDQALNLFMTRTDVSM